MELQKIGSWTVFNREKYRLSVLTSKHLREKAKLCKLDFLCENLVTPMYNKTAVHGTSRVQTMKVESRYIPIANKLKDRTRIIHTTASRYGWC